PRTLRNASRTRLRGTSRPPSRSAVAVGPFVRRRPSRSGLGQGSWPRSCTVGCVGLAPVSLGVHGTYLLCLSYSIWHTRGLPKEPPMTDSFATRARLDVNGKSYTYSSLPKLGERFDLAKLPYSMKILLENLLRHEDGVTVLPAHIEAVAKWDPKA